MHLPAHDLSSPKRCQLLKVKNFVLFITVAAERTRAPRRGRNLICICWMSEWMNAWVSELMNAWEWWMNECMDDRSCPSASPAPSPILSPWPLYLGHPGLHFLYSHVCPRIQHTWYVSAPSRPQETPPHLPWGTSGTHHTCQAYQYLFCTALVVLCNVILIKEIIYPVTVVSAQLLTMLCS